MRIGIRVQDQVTMNLIDAVEGTAKAMLAKFIDVATAGRQDASDYICNVKTVIDGTVLFVKNNPEVSESPELIQNVLYEHARKLWLDRLAETAVAGTEEETRPDLEYQAYCYDYVYNHGNYPR